MAWERLLFAHWSINPSLVKKLLPDGLELDLFDGKAWIGVIPFEMVGTRPRICPPITYFSDFPELNVRTYVIKDGKPGVWFFSLDAGSKFAVRLARATYNLPYFDAEFRIEIDKSHVNYLSKRTHSHSPYAELEVSFKPNGEIFHSTPGSLEHWLTARYCLYSANKKGRVFRGEIDHPPWPLQIAEAEIKKCDMTRICGFELNGKPESLLYADSLDVYAWATY
jgi:uncharacterized protein YqjF (DUF2071 family)